MMKIRQGFVSNSSSSSFIVFSKNSTIFHWDKEWVGEQLIAGSAIGETEFGWGPETISGPGPMINFAFLQSTENLEWRSMLEKVILEHTGAYEVVWNITDQYEDENGKDWGYIDHQSAACEGMNTEMFADENTLKAFLFCTGSEIILDNDNH